MHTSRSARLAALGLAGILLAVFSAAPVQAEPECCFYQIEGYVFADLNADGIMNGGDYGLVGWTVEAFNLTTGTIISTAVSGTGGYYLMGGLLPCSVPYGLREVVQPGWAQSSPANPNYHVLNLGACDNTVFGPFNFGNCRDVQKIYTLDAEFNEGVLNGVITNSDQLELSPTPTTFGFGWIANDDEGTISKIDLATGDELARYYTGPPDINGNYGYLSPSRTVVDIDGNCWVANRTGNGQYPSVTQILADGGLDLNGDTIIKTSSDCCPADGQTPVGTVEVLPWGQDERVIRHYRLGTTVNNPARGMTIDKMGFLWVGLSTDRRLVKVRTDHPPSVYGSNQPQTLVAEEASVPLCTGPSTCHLPYGLALSPNGFIYVSTLSTIALEVDPGLSSGGTAAGPAVTNNWIDHTPERNYGIAVDQDCTVWLAKFSGSTLGCVRWDPFSGVGNPSAGFTSALPGAQGTGRGITVDFAGDIWMATNLVDGVTKFSNTNPPVVLGNFPTAISRPTGVAVASDGNIIMSGQLSSNWEKRNVGSGANMPLAGPQLSGYHPYTYSDFTGSLQQLVSQQQGLWTVTTDGGYPGLVWTIINWNESTPPGTSVLVEARSSATVGGLPLQPWTLVTSKGTQVPPYPGRYLETRVRLRRSITCGQPFVTPILYDLNVAAICDDCFIVCPPDTTVACEGFNGSTVTYATPYLSPVCDSTWVVTCTPPSGSVFPIGVNTVLCTAVNATNDTLTCEFTVTVGGDCIPTPMGACCVGTACTVTTEANCGLIGGIYFGDGSDCTTGCTYVCLRPPAGMSSWWPFDGPASGTTDNLADASADGVLFGPPTLLSGSYVGNSYDFPGNPSTYIEVPHTPSLNLGTSDFSIDVWVKTSAGGRNPIVDKRQGSGPPIQGFFFFLQDGYPGLQLSFFGSAADFVLDAINTGPPGWVGDDQWHLIAVTVDRDDPNGIQFYVDGIPVGPTFDPTPFTSTLNTTVDLKIAQSYGHFQPVEFYQGALDELEIYRRELTDIDVDLLYAAGDAGKCREACYASQYTPCCNNEAANASFTICNYDKVSHVYSWGASALPTAVGCFAPGASSFLPPSGTLTVPAQSCVTIPIEIDCPTGTAPGSPACWQVSVFNHDTGNLFGCRGSVRQPEWWCPKWTTTGGEVVSGVFDVFPVTGGRNVVVNLNHIGLSPAPSSVDIEILALDGEGGPSPLVSLDGLPPGEPVVRTVEIPPGSVDIDVPLNIAYLEIQPIGLDRIQVRLDDDMDGAAEPVSEMLTSSGEAASVSTRDPRPEDIEPARPFLALPNPFNRSGRITFRIEGDGPQSVTLGLYDLSGRRVKIFHRKELFDPGVHTVNWDGTDGRLQRLSSGVYFLRLDTPNTHETVKVVLMR